jgi:hypothetical protein
MLSQAHLVTLRAGPEGRILKGAWKIHCGFAMYKEHIWALQVVVELVLGILTPEAIPR